MKPKTVLPQHPLPRDGATRATPTTTGEMDRRFDALRFETLSRQTNRVRKKALLDTFQPGVPRPTR